MPKIASFGLLENSSGYGKEEGPDNLWTPIEDIGVQDGCEGCADGRPVWFCDTIEHPNAMTSTMLCGNCASRIMLEANYALQPVWFTVCEEGFPDQFFPIQQTEGQPAEFYDAQQTEMIFTHQLEELVWKDGSWRVEAYINGFLHYPAAKEYRN